MLLRSRYSCLIPWWRIHHMSYAQALKLPQLIARLHRKKFTMLFCRF